jgi:hypothetical protein
MRYPMLGFPSYLGVQAYLINNYVDYLAQNILLK